VLGNELQTPRDDYGFSAIAGLELDIDVAQVSSHGGFGHEKFLRQSIVGIPLREQRKNLDFLFG
jgi:hypothetical protein